MPIELVWLFLVILFEALVFAIALALVHMAASGHDREMAAEQAAEHATQGKAKQVA